MKDIRYSEISLYHLYNVNNTPVKVTPRPTTLDLVRDTYGNIRKLEQKGFKVVFATKVYSTLKSKN